MIQLLKCCILWVVECAERGMVPGDGIEPPTRGFSIDASNITLIISIS